MRSLAVAIMVVLLPAVVLARVAMTRPALPHLVRWVDPTEHAFSVKVPKGWLVAGGTHRNSPTDAEMWINARSADGSMRVWIGYPYILPHQEPNPAYYGLGWYEGRVVQSEAGPLLIQRFAPGAQFAQSFTYKAQCRNARTLSVFDLPSETQRMNTEVAAVAAPAGVQATASAGEYIYHCGDRMGYTYAVTVLSAGQMAGGPRLWVVYKLGGYVSSKAQVVTARYVMNTMIASFAVDRDWQAAYERQIHDTYGTLMEISNRITQESMRIAQQSLQQNVNLVEQRQRQFDQMTNSSMESFHRQQASQDAIRQRWSDITLGQIHGCDDLGNCQTISNDYQDYWTKDGRTVVGGPSDGSAPGPEYHKWNPDY